MEAREHVLRVSGVAVAPGLVGEGVLLAGAVVALVEGDGYEGGGVVVCVAGVFVPGGDGEGGEGFHVGLGGEAGVE